MWPYALSAVAGLVVGLAYGLVGLRSPALPIIALLGLLGMLAGEASAHWLRPPARDVAPAPDPDGHAG